MERLNKLRKYEIIGVPFVIIFTFVLVSLFSNINSNIGWINFINTNNISLFEIAQHIFISIIIYSAFEFTVFGEEYKNFVFAKTASAVITPFIFIFLTYFLNSMMLTTDSSLYIATFLVAVTLGQLLSYYFLREGYYFKLMNAYSIFGIILLLIIFYTYVNSKTYLSPIFEPLDSYEKLITDFKDTNQRLR